MRILIFSVRSSVLCLLAVAVLACGEGYRPKPVGYHRIDLPQPQYRLLDTTYPYHCEVSAHAVVQPDRDKLAEPHWIDIDYPQFGAQVQITYKPVVGGEKTLAELIEDSRKLTNKHQIKASGIEEYLIKTKQGHAAYFFELRGEVPTQVQFYTTDSVAHFMRAALYFRTASKNDSLAPVIKYIANDLVHLVQTLEWKDERLTQRP